MKCGAGVHIPLRMKRNNFSNHYHLKPLSGQTFNLSNTLVYEKPTKRMTFPSASALFSFSADW